MKHKKELTKKELLEKKASKYRKLTYAIATINAATLGGATPVAAPLIFWASRKAEELENASFGAEVSDWGNEELMKILRNDPMYKQAIEEIDKL